MADEENRVELRKLPDPEVPLPAETDSKEAQPEAESQPYLRNIMKPHRTWRQRCCPNPKLIPLKFLIFLLHGATSAIYPFFTIHMLAIGLTLTETGIIFALLPLVGCIGPPLAGALADKLGNYKRVVVAFILLSVLFHALLGFAVPVYSYKITTYSKNWSGPFAETICSHDGVQFNFDTSNATNNKWCSNAIFGYNGGLCFKGQTKKLHCTNWTHIDQSVIPNFDISSKMLSVKICDPPRKETFNQTAACVAPNMISFEYDKIEAIGNRLVTFSLYTLFRVFGAMVVSCVMQLVDASTVLMAKQHDGDFGIQRMFALFGSLTFPPLSGFLISVASKNSKTQDYSPAFYLFCSMYTLGAILMWRMDLQIKPPAKQLWAQVWKLLKNAKVFSFVIVMFLVGCFYGILENYLFWFMQEFLRSPKWLLGMTNTVAGIAAIPVVACSTLIIRVFGHTKIFMLSLVFYGVRFLAYSFIYNAYLILPVEILEAYTFSLTWVVATVYCGKIAPGYLATLQGLIGSMHYAMGRGSGALVAGILFDHFPPRSVYQGVAGVCFYLGLLYAFLHYTMLRKSPNPKTPQSRSNVAKNLSPRKLVDSSPGKDATTDALLRQDL